MRRVHLTDTQRDEAGCLGGRYVAVLTKCSTEPECRVRDRRADVSPDPSGISVLHRTAERYRMRHSMLGTPR